LGGEVEMLKAMQTGTIDMAFITGAPLPTVVPEVGVFNIPFLFRDAAHAHAALDGPIGAKALASFKSKDLVALAWGENGMRHITNSKRPIVSADDLKGLKLRLPQSEVMMAAFKAMAPKSARWHSRNSTPHCRPANSTARKIRSPLSRRRSFSRSRNI
jgi:TRAP-type C4-dicarboxylate transport system substrate-binding protein